MLKALPMNSLYRLLIKGIGKYPSVNRLDIYKEIKISFRAHRGLTDPKTIEVEKKKAIMGLAHILMYIEKSNELQTLKYNTKTEYESLNPNDEHFIHF